MVDSDACADGSGSRRGVVLFPGQGAQQLGMGLDLAESELAAREVFEVAEDVLGLDLRGILAGDERAALDRTDVCQPAILATSMAAMAALSAAGEGDRLAQDRVAAVAGLSLGEYSALTWAGALELRDALRLVQARGVAMQAAAEERPSGMLSLVGATAESAGELCDGARGDGVLVVANLLAPGQVAIAGTLDAIERASAMIREYGIRKAVPLAVAGAFHSPCMASAAGSLAAALADTPIAAPRVPVVMNVTGEATQDPETIRDLLQRQITSPVLWQRSMEHMLGMGCDQFLEPAPGRQLTNMLKRYDQQSTSTTCGTVEALHSMAPWPGTLP
jgi:[acyl-carrier-protein] S-malonyltransferase